MTRGSAFRSVSLPLLAALAALAACSSSDEAPDLMRFRNNTSAPDEFVVVPTKPLQTPDNTAVLPVPTPGSSNRADQTPVADAVAALGGSPSALNRSGIPASDSALLAYAGRDGTDPGIRDTLAEEDLAWRRRNNMRPLERIANTNGYYDAYRQMQLDQQAELERLRARGVIVPSAPPAVLKPE
ncbi:DUF3035 domain-containing protein [Mangrovicoccus sp. HB161399]|uniref:DUF3035 domain-containing protein n=1 Tax=Mangrovicoccus sp. HB161399 TaxID=2720392 RepID=UPI00155626F1|nr:DUF3035 domain-containing protein [Mangrovicoccus sp. HB161399]